MRAHRRSFLFVFLSALFHENFAQLDESRARTTGGDTEFVEPFNVPLEELEKETKKMTTLTEQCAQYKNHYDYYCQRSNIAKYNEEVRIICERYDLLCRDRVPATIDHIRRQKVMWRAAGVPKATEKKLVDCYTSCRENDPLCVQACECIFLGWVMDRECEPGAADPALINCQRWYEKCKSFWRIVPDFTPYQHGEYAAKPIVRGIFYGYDGLGISKVFDKVREHGVSFWRGTNTVIVNWPEGKVGTATTFDVPAAGVEGVFNAVDVGFPNLATFYREALGSRGLNPGTGRRRL